MNHRQLRELKAKKAKFGFALDSIGLGDFIFGGRLLDTLEQMYAKDTWAAELVGMHQRDLRIYTDDEHIAAWLRQACPGPIDINQPTEKAHT
jgi:hypothetical protein